MEKLVIGINSGFDSTKVCVDGKETCFETVLSEYQEGIFSLARNRGIHLQDSAGENLVVGREALQYGKKPIHPQDNKWFSSPYFLHIFRAALSEATDQNRDASIVISLPISVYRTQKEQIKATLEGSHEFTRAGRERQLINNSRVTILPEAVGTACGEMFSEAGRILNKALWKGKIAVLDIGSKHTNTAVLVEFADVPHQTKALELGCWDIIADIKAMLEKKFDRELTEYQSRDILQTKTLMHKGAPVDCAQEVETFTARFFDKLQTEILKLWDDWKSLDVIFITGGGAYLLGERFQAKFSQAVVIHKPVFGNAIGNLRFGKWLESEGI